MCWCRTFFFVCSCRVVHGGQRFGPCVGPEGPPLHAHPEGEWHPLHRLPLLPVQQRRSQPRHAQRLHQGQFEGRGQMDFLTDRRGERTSHLSSNCWRGRSIPGPIGLSCVIVSLDGMQNPPLQLHPHPPRISVEIKDVSRSTHFYLSFCSPGTTQIWPRNVG